MEKKFYWAGSKSDGKASEASGDSNSECITAVHNHIYFYSDVEINKVLKLNKLLRETDNKLVNQSFVQSSAKPTIYLHINSYGGSIFAAISSVDAILSCQCDVTTIVEGCAASAGTLISVVGTKRWITRHSYMLIHQLSSGFWGKYQEFEDEKKNLDRLMKMIKDIYKEYAKVPVKDLNEILKHDLWWDAEKCHKYCLVDEII